MTQSAPVLGSEGFGNKPLHKIRYGIKKIGREFLNGISKLNACSKVVRGYQNHADSPLQQRL
jgi:hypothetical protein